jgi:hypothetical protein
MDKAARPPGSPAKRPPDARYDNPGFEWLLQLLAEDEEVTIVEEFDAENYPMNLGFTNPAWRIERNDLAIQLSNYCGRYFVSECKRNKNHFESLEAEDHMLLHNW